MIKHHLFKSPTEAWGLEQRRDDLRSAIYLMIVTGNTRDQIKAPKCIESFGAQIKETTFNKWWAEELSKYEIEQAERLTRVPPNSDIVGEGK